MKKIEEQLKMKKVQIDEIEVPQELEEKLRSALENSDKLSKESSKRKPWIMRHKGIAAIIAFFMFFGIYNLDVLAYLGRKIVGYDEISSESLRDLNELGMVQEINKSYTFKNGVQLIVDGVMMDDNKMVVMYRFIGEDKVNEIRMSSLSVSTKFGQCLPLSGRGTTNEEETEFKWIGEYERPFILAKTLTFTLVSQEEDESKGEVAEITFKLDRSKVLKGTIKSSLNETVEFEGVKYNFRKLTATPLSIVLEGNIEVSSEKYKKLFDPGFSLPNYIDRELRVELIETYLKDGKELTETIQVEGWGRKTRGKRIYFDYEFSGLKPNLKKLVLRAVKIEDVKRIDREIKIKKDISNLRIVPDTEELIIQEVREENGDTIVVFQAEKDVAFDTTLFLGEEQVEELSKDSKIVTVNGQEVLQVIYKFKGYSEDRVMVFNSLSHESYINKDIVIYQE